MLGQRTKRWKEQLKQEDHVNWDVPYVIKRLSEKYCTDCNFYDFRFSQSRFLMLKQILASV